jgi:hypothetical protein
MRTTDTVRALFAMSLIALVACTGGSEPKPAQAAPPPAELRVDELRILASVVDTLALPSQMARQYDIPREEDTWMLLVVVQRGPEGQETAVRAKVDAQARTLNGQILSIPMRETRTADGFVDNIGVFETSPPDTLQFTLRVTPEGAPTRTLTFMRELVP